MKTATATIVSIECDGCERGLDYRIPEDESQPLVFARSEAMKDGWAWRPFPPPTGPLRFLCPDCIAATAKGA